MHANSNTDPQLSQEESREPDEVDAVVQDVDARPEPPDPEPAPHAELKEAGIEKFVDPGTFRVMRGRKSERPTIDRVKALVEAILRGVSIPPVIVYEDLASSERFSPDGGHRQAAYLKLNRPIPILLFRIHKAKARAEEESCGANTGNSRSRSDQKFQLAKAHTIYKEKFGKEPKPSDLAKMTGINHTTCTAFLREALAPKQKDAPEVEEDERQQKVITAVQKAHKLLQAINPDDDWVAGKGVINALAEITEEVNRIKKHRQQEAVVNPQDLKNFMDANNLTLEQMGRLVGVKHTTVSRWLGGKTKITPHNQRIIRQVLTLNPGAIAALLEPNNEQQP